MKNLIIALLTWSSLSVFGQTSLKGVWNAGEDNTKIEITETGSVATGKLKSSDNTETTVGTVILKNVKKQGDHWVGQIYAAKRKEWYDAELSVSGDVLEIEITVGIFSKTLEWKRVE